MKKILIWVMIGCIVISNNVIIMANENILEKNEMINTLVQKGYTKETAEALNFDELEEIYNSILEGKMIGISTNSIEIDELAEIENYVSCSKEQLEFIGLTEEEIEETDKNIDNIRNMSNSELTDNYGWNDTQIKLLRKAIKNGDNARNNNIEKKIIKNSVHASGSISSSDLSYTQYVYSNSNSKPSYAVRLSYNWSKVYSLACYDDKIAIAWGGKLNSKSEYGTAYYYNNVGIFSKFTTYANCKKMDIDCKVQKGIIFTFPQSNGYDANLNKVKTKMGSAGFTLYQTKFKGYDTKIISKYCHRTIAINGATLSISGSPEITVGAAWDTTVQKQQNIRY